MNNNVLNIAFDGGSLIFLEDSFDLEDLFFSKLMSSSSTSIHSYKYCLKPLLYVVFKKIDCFTYSFMIKLDI